MLEVCGGVARTGGGGGKVPVTLMSAPPAWPSTRWEHDGLMVSHVPGGLPGEGADFR